MFTVLGARGFIGRNCVKFLSEQGHTVATPEPDQLLEGKASLGHVIYCIGLTADFRHRPFATVEAHVGLLEKTLKNTKFDSFTYLSSTRVYQGAEEGREDANLQVNPNDPSDLYNITKLAGESLCLTLDNPNIRVARLSNVAGYDETSENFIQAIIRDGIKGEIKLQASPDSHKDFIMVEDVAALLAEIATKGEHRLYNLASGENTRFADIVDTLADILACKKIYDPAAPLSTFPPINVDRIRQEFDYNPQSFTLKLPQLVEQYKN